VTGLVTHLATFGAALRQGGVRVGIADEMDAAQALARVDLADIDEVRDALRIALKVRRNDQPVFDALFTDVWLNRGRRVTGPRGRPMAIRPMPARALEWRLSQVVEEGGQVQPEGREPGYSPEARLRQKPFDELDDREIAAMERLIARLAPALATEKSRRLVPVRGRGMVDLRRSLRRLPGTGGELLTPARRARAVEEPRLVLLCDTSGSMDLHTRFLLGFAIALRRTARRVEVFAFNTDLTRLTSHMAPGKPEVTLRRLGPAVPGWAGGTRIGGCLADFVERHLTSTVNGRSTVVILSDGLDQGEPEVLVRAMRAIRARARRVLWLNPLLGDSRYQPTARGMAAALPFVDRLAPAHNLESLEQLVSLLTN
jgi:uncharacterized protein with von Willebrand factor type A (vWA) domain